MTGPFDAMRYQRALERWRALADRRLEHMTQLYDTGRWRRYFTEEKFLSIIRETRDAADQWHRLAPDADHADRFARTAVEAVLPSEPLPPPCAELERSVA